MCGGLGGKTNTKQHVSPAWAQEMLVKFKIKRSWFRQLQNLIISNFSLLPGRPSKCYEFCGFPFRQNTPFCLCFCPAAGRPPAPANFDCKKFLKTNSSKELFKRICSRNFLTGCPGSGAPPGNTKRAINQQRGQGGKPF